MYGNRAGGRQRKKDAQRDGKAVHSAGGQADSVVLPETVERSGLLDECILVTGESDIPYVRREIVERYGFHKVKAVIAGGRERYESVYKALCAMAEEGAAAENREGYVFIHDGARPFLTEAILEATYREACRHRACVAAVPVKDTIKIADKDGFVVETPDRSHLWTVQTPQVFEASLIAEAYRMLFRRQAEAGQSLSPMTPWCWNPCWESL